MKQWIISGAILTAISATTYATDSIVGSIADNITNSITVNLTGEIHASPCILPPTQEQPSTGQGLTEQELKKELKNCPNDGQTVGISKAKHLAIYRDGPRYINSPDPDLTTAVSRRKRNIVVLPPSIYSTEHFVLGYQ